MSGLRFKAGELAILAVSTDDSATGCEGEIVEIYLVGPFVPGDVVLLEGVKRVRILKYSDYVIRWPGTTTGGIVKDWQLRKIDPSAEPESITRRLEVGEEVA